MCCFVWLVSCKYIPPPPPRGQSNNTTLQAETAPTIRQEFHNTAVQAYTQAAQLHTAKEVAVYVLV